MSSLLSVPGLAKTSPWFRWAMIQIGARLNIDPDYLLNVMSVESGFNPAATNTYTSATGLIQFMPKTAERLGTTVGALRGMSAEDQLFYVEKFYRPFAGRLHAPGDAYMATFMPAFVGSHPSTVLFAEGSKGYEQNAGLDRDKSGTITVSDVTGAAEANYARAAKLTRTEVAEEEPPRPKAGPGSPGSPSEPLLPPIIRFGSRGRDVVRWQIIVGTKPDGIFGPLTRQATILWQRARGLKSDGIVGPKTWKVGLS